MLKELEKSEFSRIYEIMKESFPFDEIRSYEGQKNLLNHKSYKILVFKENDDIIGFLAVWNFENFVFVEHFAISHMYRNKGLGNSLLDELENYTDKTIILEVEHATDDIKIRRIEFYKRKGFKLFDFDYIMPAFTDNHKPVELYLMSKSDLTKDAFNDFYDKIVNVVNVY